jgi:Txe/YoeB family toxin of toxin-antitoxin system
MYIFFLFVQTFLLLLGRKGLDGKARELIGIISRDPVQTRPPFEKLLSVKNIYSRRINIRHRLVYEVQHTEHIIIIRMMFKHYGDWSSLQFTPSRVLYIC